VMSYKLQSHKTDKTVMWIFESLERHCFSFVDLQLLQLYVALTFRLCSFAIVLLLKLKRNYVMNQYTVGSFTRTYNWTTI